MGGKVITILLFVFLINISLSISEKVEKADLSKANKKARKFPKKVLFSMTQIYKVPKLINYLFNHLPKL